MDQQQRYDFEDPDQFPYSPQHVVTGGLTMPSWTPQVAAPLQFAQYAVAENHIPEFQAPAMQWRPMQIDEGAGAQLSNRHTIASPQMGVSNLGLELGKNDFSNHDSDTSTWILPGLNNWNSPNAPSNPDAEGGIFSFSTEMDQMSPPALIHDTGTTPYPELGEPVSPEEVAHPGELRIHHEPTEGPCNNQLQGDHYVARNESFQNMPVHRTQPHSNNRLPMNSSVAEQYPNEEPSWSYLNEQDAVYPKAQKAPGFVNGQRYVGSFSNGLGYASPANNGANVVVYRDGQMRPPFPNRRGPVSYPNRDRPAPYLHGQIPVPSVEEEIWVPEHSSSPTNTYPTYSPPQPNPYPNLTPQQQQSSSSYSNLTPQQHSTSPPVHQQHLQQQYQPQAPSLSSSQSSNRQVDNERLAQDALLLKGKAAGLTYKQIKQQIGGNIAESTLRGRYRSLTKAREARVRRPVWTAKDIQLLTRVVRSELERVDDASYRALSRDQKLNKLSWKRVSDYIAINGGSYRFGNSTCKKKWMEIEPAQEQL